MELLKYLNKQPSTPTVKKISTFSLLESLTPTMSTASDNDTNDKSMEETKVSRL